MREKAIATGLVERCAHGYDRIFCPRDAPYEGTPGLAPPYATCTVAAQCPRYGQEWIADEPPVPFDEIETYAQPEPHPRWRARCTAWPNGRRTTIICPRSTFDMFVERHAAALVFRRRRKRRMS